MSEPNLPFLHIALGPVSQGSVNADEIRDKIPKLPDRVRQELEDIYCLTDEQAYILVVSTYYVAKM